MSAQYDVVIGLEIHTQLSTRSKIWCNCEIATMALENTRICEVCTGQPGTLPALNQKVVEYGIMVALATGAKINHLSYFDRKNYFYPDLPKGYQITQFEVPLAQDGALTILDENQKEKKIGIERIQIEEDTGKSVHDGNHSLVNLNRCGTPLLEIVGRPDLTTAKEASSYLKKLHSILVYLGVCHGNLQEGNFRCDVNLSLKPKGANKYGTRTEIKNLNSFKFVEKAIEVEIERQKEILGRGDKVIQQTLNFDAATGKISVLREKSDAHDYRYFAEPDLLPLVVQESTITAVRGKLPELPEGKQARFVKTYEIPIYDAEVLTSTKELAQYFETTVSKSSAVPKKVSNWIMVELLKLLNESGTSIEKSPVSPEGLGKLLSLIHEDKVSGKMGKEIFQHMYDTRKSPDEAIQELGINLISDTGAIEIMAQEVFKENATQLSEYLSGKEKLFGHFVGQLMKKTKGQASPAVANTVLKKLLDAMKNV